MLQTQGAYHSFTGEEKMGNKAQPGKPQLRSPWRPKTAPSLHLRVECGAEGAAGLQGTM